MTIEFKDVGVRFGTKADPFWALRGADLTIGDNEFLSVVGTSGCGKSTLLSTAAGLQEATEGVVLVDGAPITGTGRDRGVVFQSYTLLPWLTAAGNIDFALREAGVAKAERAERVAEMLDAVGLRAFADRYPAELSGGMRQRVAIARVLSYRPSILLMDEPFGALDALTRAHLQDQLMEIHLRLKNTVIMITHDVDEAVLLSDRIVMMTNGPSATIGEVLSVPLARPRKRLELVEDPTYTHARAEVLEFLYARHAKPAIAA